MKILRILTSLSLLVTGFSAKSQCSAQFDFGFISCESVQFTVDTINPQASYLWNFGDGSSEYSNGPEHYFTVDGTYPVTLTVTDSLNNCVDTLTAWVNVACDTMGVDSCNAYFNYSYVTCDSVWFTPWIYNSSVDYSWDFGDGSVSNDGYPAHQYAADGAYTVTLTVADTLSNCWSIYSDVVYIWCDSLITDSCDAQFNYSFVTCDSVWFTPVTYNASAWYSWDFGDGTSSNDPFTAHTFTADGIYTVTLTIVDSLNNCWNYYTGWVNVWCDSLPTDSCNAWFDYSFITCDSAWFMPYYYNPSADYLWDFGDGTSSNASSPAHAFAADGVYDVTLTVVDSLNNCWNTFSTSVYVFCDSLPSDSCNAWFDYYYVTCDSLWFMAYDYSPTADYLWDFGDGVSGYGSSTSHMYASDGMYTVTLTVVDSLNNCWSTYSNWVYVMCDSIPSDSCTASFEYYFAACDSAAWFGPVVYNPYAWYTWDFGDGTPADYNAYTTHYFATPGIYTVTLSVLDSMNNCWDFVSQTIVVTCDSTLTVQDQEALEGVTIYPNPSTGIFTIELDAADVTIQVYDLLGNLVVSTACTDDCRYYTVDLTDLANGAYNLVLLKDDRLETRRLVKH